MRFVHFLLPLAFLLSFSVSCAQVHAPVGVTQQTAHQITFTAMHEWRRCSSTAVGPHTLVSAAHCALGTGMISVDGTARHIQWITFDEWDHFLVAVDGPAFPQYLPIAERAPHPQEHIQIWGWPGDATKPIHRDGALLAIDIDKDDEEWEWQLPVYQGDSGAGLITDDNTIISVVSLGNVSAWSASYPFQFTPEQLRSIQ